MEVEVSGMHNTKQARDDRKPKRIPGSVGLDGAQRETRKFGP